jgi:hypothetical protein
MKHVGPIELQPLTPEVFGRPAKRKSIFKCMLVALHLSRRRQARGVMRRYRDLLAEDSWSQPAQQERKP